MFINVLNVSKYDFFTRSIASLAVKFLSFLSFFFSMNSSAKYIFLYISIHISVETLNLKSKTLKKRESIEFSFVLT